MKKTVFFLFIALMLAPFSHIEASIALPSVVINEQSRECYPDFPSGDECVFCTPPEGWMILGSADNTVCPEGYKVIGMLKGGACTGYENHFCCSEGHSGGAGSCQHLIINKWEKECAFAVDISDCNNRDMFIEGWKKAEKNALCPEGYSWAEEKLDCKRFTALPIEDGADELGEGGKIGLEKIEEAKMALGKKVDRYVYQLFFLTIGLITLFFIILVVLLFYHIKRRK